MQNRMRHFAMGYVGLRNIATLQTKLTKFYVSAVAGSTAFRDSPLRSCSDAA